ncbi:MAG: serine hydrolase [Clostridia bacterium]|nr:serine hydrolase [Clostridia bacterium]
MKILDADKLRRAVSLRAEEDIKSGDIVGASVYVSQKGKILLNECFGFKTADRKVRLMPNDMFRLASMTKPIIAVAILKLIERGKLDLFDRADKFIDGFNGFYVGKLEGDKVIPLKKTVNPIRVVDLLTHSSGLVSGELAEFYGRKRTAEDKKNLNASIEFYKKTCLAFEPYCGNAYSAVAGFDVLAKIIEIISDCDIEYFLKKEIFQPLEMVDTTFTPSKEQWERLVDMQGTVDGKNVAVDMHGCVFSDFPVTYKCGGAGLVSTIKDYSNFAEMLGNGGEFKGKRILPFYLVRSMGIPHLLEQYADSDTSWGLGVRVLTAENPYLPVGCFGWSGAYGTHFWIDPTNEVVAIYMRNSVNAGGSGAITARNFETDVTNAFGSDTI